MFIEIERSTKVSDSIRARQLCGMFDVPAQEKQTLNWAGEVPIEARDWNVGLIVGPSGCGKSTIAQELFRDHFGVELEWRGKSVIDDFADAMPIADIASLCQSVGFNTIPAWLRPYTVLSNGEKFRVDLARRLSELPSPIVVDEFTSVVDRRVAQIGSYAVQKAVRKRGIKFVAVSCHNDIIEWLQPDWVLEPATMTFSWRELRRRPDISIEILKVNRSVWKFFAPYHYMSAALHAAAQCYCLYVDDTPAAFAAMLYRPHAQVRNIWGLSRIVTLPDYQGLGLAFVLMDTLASAFKALGARYHAYPAHPALIRSYDRSNMWRLRKKPGIIAKNGHRSGLSFGGRPNAVFEYVGPPMTDRQCASRLVAIRSLACKPLA